MTELSPLECYSIDEVKEMVKSFRAYNFNKKQNLNDRRGVYI